VGRAVRSPEELFVSPLLFPLCSQPPLLTMDPPWTPQFLRQSVKLTCGDPSVSISTTWYTDGRWWKETPSNSLHVELSDRRKYRFQCQTRGSELSSAVNLAVSDDWLLLQVPTQAVLEGDSLSLRCSAWKNAKLSEVQFFHDGQLLHNRHGNEVLLSPAKQQHSGRYQCSAYVHSFTAWWEVSPQNDLVVRGEPEQRWVWGGFGVALGWVWISYWSLPSSSRPHSPSHTPHCTHIPSLSASSIPPGFLHLSPGPHPRPHPCIQ
uniref:Ig-like domain-containing protein n=1 Tax=Meleagris gallopavo TaxID=9103 RepID=A0A803YB81_MELGA